MTVHVKCDSCGGSVDPVTNNTARMKVKIKRAGISGIEYEIPAVINLD